MACVILSVCVCGWLWWWGGCLLCWYKSKGYCTCEIPVCCFMKPNHITFAYLLVCFIWPVFFYSACFCLAYLLLLQSPYFLENLFVLASYLSVSLNAVYLLASSLSSQPAWKVMCTGKLNERHSTNTYMWVLHLQDIMGFFKPWEDTNWGYYGMENEIQ